MQARTIILVLTMGLLMISPLAMYTQMTAVLPVSAQSSSDTLERYYNGFEDSLLGYTTCTSCTTQNTTLPPSANIAVPLQLTKDGRCNATAIIQNTSLSCYLNTRNHNDVLVAIVDLFHSAVTTTSEVNITDGACSSWTPRYPARPSAPSHDFEFYCRSPNALTWDNVTTQFPSSVASLIVFAASNVNYSNPFDQSPTLTSISLGTGSGPSVAISTTNKYDFIFGWFRSSSIVNGTVPPGMNVLAMQNVSTADVLSEGLVVTTSMSAYNLFLNLTASTTWFGFGDALAGMYTKAPPSLPSVVQNVTGQANSMTLTRQTAQSKTFQAFGQFWAFSADNEGAKCQTSANDQQFSSPEYFISRSGGGTGGDFEARWNSKTNTVMIGWAGLAKQSNFSIWIGSLPTTNPTCGGIVFSADNVSVPVANGGIDVTAPSLTWDKYGNYWAAWNDNETNQFHLVVYECKSACSSSSNWGLSYDYNTQMPYTAGKGFEPVMDQLSNGAVFWMIGAVTRAHVIALDTFNPLTNSWNPMTTSGGKFTFGGLMSGSAVTIGNTIYIADPDQQGKLHLLSCTYPCSTTLNDKVLKHSGISASLSTDGLKQLVLTFLTKNQSNIDYIVSNDKGKIFSPAVRIASGLATSNGGTMNTGVSIVSLTTARYEAFSGNISVLFTEGGGWGVRGGNGSTDLQSCPTGYCQLVAYYFDPS